MVKKITAADLEQVAGMSSREAAAVLGVGKSTINNAREKARLEGLHGPQVNAEYEASGSAVPENEEQVNTFLAERGISPLTHEINYRLGAWDGPGGVQHSFRATAVSKGAPEPAVDWASGERAIATFDFVPAKKEFLTDTAVIQPSDYQIGKTDIGGGTQESTERALSSFSRFAAIVEDARPQTILIANTGDIIENFCNTAAQQFTNDMDLPHQISHAFALELEAIKMLAPLARTVVYATVPSNHGQWRMGPKPAGNSHADWGISIAEQVSIAVNMSTIDNVVVHIPQLHMESMTLQVGTSRIGLVHGHQVSGADKLGDWWAKQDHGRMPTWDADILLAGHHHSFRSYQSGDGRWVFVGPSTDPGSSWYANLTGQRAVAGMLTFFTDNGAWHDLQIV